MFLSPKGSKVDSERKMSQESISASLTNLNVDTVSQLTSEVPYRQIKRGTFFSSKIHRGTAQYGTIVTIH